MVLWFYPQSLTGNKCLLIWPDRIVNVKNHIRTNQEISNAEKVLITSIKQKVKFLMNLNGTQYGKRINRLLQKKTKQEQLYFAYRSKVKEEVFPKNSFSHKGQRNYFNFQRFPKCHFYPSLPWRISTEQLALQSLCIGNPAFQVI